MSEQHHMTGAVLLLAAALLGAPAMAQEHDHSSPPAGESSPTSQGGKLWSQADAIHGVEAMDAARAHALHEMGAMTQTFIMADRLEVQGNDDGERFVWDLQGWRGGDIDKLWLKAEGELDFETDDVEEAEVQALWSHAFATYWDVQTGLRYDIEPDGLAHAVLGVQGLAPYLFEVDAAAFLSEEGDVTARVEAEYELHFTQRLILQPRIELELSGQDIPERGLGSGLSSVNAGMRLRYEIAREFAPYLGVEWSRSLGDTADYVRAAGDDPDVTRWVAGVRLWY